MTFREAEAFCRRGCGVGADVRSQTWLGAWNGMLANGNVNFFSV